MTIYHYELQRTISGGMGSMPFGPLCFFETSAGLYWTLGAFNKKVYKTIDEGVTVTQVDVDPNDSSPDNKSRDYPIHYWGATWNDRLNSLLYLMDFYWNNNYFFTNFFSRI